MALVIRIRAQRAVRRCGVAHPAEATDHPADRWSAEELARLEAEPMLLVERIETAPPEAIPPEPAPPQPQPEPEAPQPEPEPQPDAEPQPEAPQPEAAEPEADAPQPKRRKA